jgi:hypothetical protein
MSARRAALVLPCFLKIAPSREPECSPGTLGKSRALTLPTVPFSAPVTLPNCRATAQGASSRDMQAPGGTASPLVPVLSRSHSDANNHKKLAYAVVEPYAEGSFQT